MAKLPDPSRVPRGLIGSTIESYTVGSWCSTQDGSGPATAVCIELVVDGIFPLYMRLKTPEAVDTMIAALKRHKADVWPGAK